MAKEEETVNWAYFSRKSTTATSIGDSVAWTEDLYSNPAYFECCDGDEGVISLLHPGVYQIQSKLGKALKAIAYTAFTTEPCDVEVSCSRVVDAGATIQILLVSLLPIDA
ncbi:hypothetical protein H257_12800 [Aphanomyces astaci]|uniref:Uncharacterized protein n=1 Tax=Aphanomyces astaci TaxID=112090 RepID=W4FYW3_APHAT|nr:hypothetical protein H257_12800 [Aphanomyces astaci]ETV71989.1 hypothetical protein H257_12800 [Aphanomyces astaci]RQM12291.1 hypothetical protein B5M09_010639 [Aphanomyces astaci]|eukprot:XP_009838432.1 hypothetical protein H257_12800 [Aphanomyces astaci]